MHATLLLLTRAPDAGESAFRACCVEAATRLAAELPGLAGCVVNHVLDSARRMPVPRGAFAVDGLVQLAGDGRDWAAEPAYAALIESLRPCTTAILALDTRRHDVIAPPEPPRGGGSAPMAKRMSILERDSSVTLAGFQAWWLTVHGPKVKDVPELRGSRQYHLRGARPEWSAAPGAVWVPDGVTELWLEDMAAMERAFPPVRAAGVGAHAATRIARMTTLIVEDHRIL
ncbi:EthD domain-containing protein [Falsiroseomonas sp. HW251]|uniref:EthD domain-containing protein n=1 Tax=Falsiroseomonas sp. HW251 TaxID=3390998 RepID=UPI003D321FC7